MHVACIIIMMPWLELMILLLLPSAAVCLSFPVGAGPPCQHDEKSGGEKEEVVVHTYMCIMTSGLDQQKVRARRSGRRRQRPIAQNDSLSQSTLVFI